MPTTSRATALRKITSQGVEAVLGPAGFAPAGRRAWVRSTAELQHVVGLLSRRGMYDVQWSVVSPEAVPYFWGVPAKFGDVGHAVVSGTPSSIHHPAAGESFRLDADPSTDEVEAIVRGLATDLSRVEQRLRVFTTRREVREYLLLNRDPTDRRDFLIPANLPLKLFTAATLAVLDGDPGACGLVVEAEAAMARFKDDLSLARLQRLRQGSSALCG